MTLTLTFDAGSGALPKENKLGGIVLAKRAIEEGTLEVVADNGVAVCQLTPDNDLAEPTDEIWEGREPWWLKMYLRRAFTPLEFYAAEENITLSGPFRHKHEGPPRSALPSLKKRELHHGVVKSFCEVRGYGFVETSVVSRFSFIKR